MNNQKSTYVSTASDRGCGRRALIRLVGAKRKPFDEWRKRKRSSGNNAITQFSYDLAGNRLTAGASTYTYANNRLSGALHDTAGNITNLVRGTTTLRMSWNTLGQLTSVTTNNVLAESYAYDPLGRRVKTTAGGATVYHVYNGDECAADLDSSGNPLRSYTWGQGIDNLLAMTVYRAFRVFRGQITSSYRMDRKHKQTQCRLNLATASVRLWTCSFS